MLTIGDRIKTVRAGMTQREFADSLGITAQAVINYEKHGRTPRREVLNKISDVCGVSVDWLLTGENRSTGGVSAEQKWAPGARFAVHEDVQPLEISQNGKNGKSQNGHPVPVLTSHDSGPPDVLAQLLASLKENAALLREIADLREARARLEARVAALEAELATHTHTQRGGMTAAPSGDG